jgi:hypothetical protein
MGINRKVFYVECIISKTYSGIQFKAGDIRKFYSLLKAKHFIKKAPDGMFQLKPPKKPDVKDQESSN